MIEKVEGDQMALDAHTGMINMREKNEDTMDVSYPIHHPPFELPRCCFLDPY